MCDFGGPSGGMHRAVKKISPFRRSGNVLPGEGPPGPTPPPSTARGAEVRGAARAQRKRRPTQSIFAGEQEKKTTLG